MSYAVKEIFYTLQGEGLNVGRPAVFCRFAGCNLWSGRETDRAIAKCNFCDTDFVGIGPDGGRFLSAENLADVITEKWPSAHDPRSVTQQSPPGRPLVVCTGGEPLLQLDDKLIRAIKARGFELAVETNGTQEAPDGIDHLCVSPKPGNTLRVRSGTELKLVYPQRDPDTQPENFQELAFSAFFLQPMDGPALIENTAKSIEYCLSHPKWRLSIQTHKLVGLR